MRHLNKILITVFATLLYSNANFAAEGEIRLFMADGQLKSHPVRVFITKDIEPKMKPKLKLTGSHAITEKQQGEEDLIAPLLIARNQQNELKINGNKVTYTGTLLLFDLSNYPIPFYKAVMRLTPTLVWTEKEFRKEVQQVAIGAHEVNLGNPLTAFAWSFTLIIGLVLFIIVLCKLGKTKALYLICETNKRLSLSRTQVAAWTVAIGGVVAGFGIIRIEIPSIPDSLVALMGLSLATGGISYLRTSKFKTAAPAADHKTSIADLVKDFTTNPDGDLSLARAQMVFWTGLTLTLFVVKSILDGHLWEVPWEMVTLMGLSQASYLAPKMVAKPQ